jgi:hypothetical protein
MPKSKAYRASAVNGVHLARLRPGHEGQGLTVGLDIGRYQILAVVHWADGRFERPWLVNHPEQVPDGSRVSWGSGSGT